MNKAARLGVAVLCFLGLLTTANAAKPGYYVGAGVGMSNLDTPKEYSYDSLSSSNIKKSSQSGGLGGRLFAGYNINQYFGLEAGYARYARSKATSSGLTLAGPGNTSVNTSLYAFDLVGKGYLPLGDSGISAYALGGVARATATVDYNKRVAGQSVLNNSPTTSKFLPVYGLGVSYDVSNSPISTNLEVSRIQGTGNVKSNPHAIPTANMVSLNLAYNFD